MLRIIAVQTNWGTALHMGGPVEVTHKTFLVEAEEIERWLNEDKDKNPTAACRSRFIQGIEVVDDGAEKRV